jgi:hypothetical protein
VELLWYSFVVAYVLGAMFYFMPDHRTPCGSDCRMSAVILSRQIAGSSPPAFEVVYRCPVP